MSQEKKVKTRPSRSVRERPAPAEWTGATTMLPSEPKWHERAAFQVAFDHSVDPDGRPIWQTRAYHEEADGRGVWPGIAGEALMSWMRQRADLPSEAPTPTRPALPAAQPAEAPAAEEPAKLRLTIDQLSLEAVLAEQEIGGGSIEPRLDARINFHLSGVGGHLALANESSCLIQILAHDQAQNHVAILALEAQQLQAELLEYSMSLTFEPPPVGEYQVMALVLLPDQAVAATEFGPSLTVVSPGGDLQ